LLSGEIGKRSQVGVVKEELTSISTF